MTTKVKDPNDAQEFGFNWAPALNGLYTIVNSTWEMSSELEKIIATFTTTKSIVRIGGGVLNSTYHVVNQVTLNDGQKISKSFNLIIKE